MRNPWSAAFMSELSRDDAVETLTAGSPIRMTAHLGSRSIRTVQEASDSGPRVTEARRGTDPRERLDELSRGLCQQSNINSATVCMLGVSDRRQPRSRSQDAIRSST